MKIIIKAEAKEIAALISEIQGQQQNAQKSIMLGGLCRCNNCQENSRRIIPNQSSWHESFITR